MAVLAANTQQAFKVETFGAPLAGEIVGIDLSQSLDDADFASVRRAFLDNLVIVFRDQHFTPEQHIAFSQRFGPLQIHVLHQFHLAGHPEILIVSNVVENGKPIGLGDAGRNWHSDLSYVKKPSLGSLLHAQELPGEGGDTLFANMYAAYETLPAEVKKALEGKRAVHSYTHRYYNLKAQSDWRPDLSTEQIEQVPAVAHPVLRTHPETGRKALFVNQGFTSRILDLPEDESADLLKLLFAHSTRPENVYRHRWQDGDLLFWDNRCTVHHAPGCPPHLRRTMYRTTVQGDVPH
jgi:taurine dioxygenase